MTIYLYVKTHNETGLKYLGKTTKDPFKYNGSGTIWKNHIKKHGNYVTTEVIFETSDKNEFRDTAIRYSKEWNIVESPEWANLTVEEGQGGATYGHKGKKHTQQYKLHRSKQQKTLWTEDRKKVHGEKLSASWTEERKALHKEKLKQKWESGSYDNRHLKT